jgi:hypothetical protein
MMAMSLTVTDAVQCVWWIAITMGSAMRQMERRMPIALRTVIAGMAMSRKAMGKNAMMAMSLTVTDAVRCVWMKFAITTGRVTKRAERRMPIALRTATAGTAMLKRATGKNVMMAILSITMGAVQYA